MQIAVIGAGNGGLAMAAHLTQLGQEVRLWDCRREVLDAIARQAGILARGEVRGRFLPAMLADDAPSAVAGAELIMLAVPAFAHRDVMRRIAPALADGQTVVLNPGRTAGSLQARRALAGAACDADVTVAETQTFIYTARSTDAGHVEVFALKRQCILAAIPSGRTDRVLRLLQRFYPQMTAAANTLVTGLQNMGAILHPTPVLLNVGWIETPDVDFLHYIDGMTPSVVRYLERMDGERTAVAAAYGQPSPSLREWLGRTYGIEAPTLYEAIQRNAGYASLRAPKDLRHRYVREDVPTGLVPLSALGGVAGVPTPYIDLIVDLACRLLDEDFRSSGRSLAALGLSDAREARDVLAAFEGRDCDPA